MHSAASLSCLPPTSWTKCKRKFGCASVSAGTTLAVARRLSLSLRLRRSAAMAIFLLVSVSLAVSCPPSACNGFGNSMCPGAAVLDSKPIWPLGPKNLWFRNVARWPVEVMVVSPEGDEESRGILAPEVRRPHGAVHGEVPTTPPSHTAPPPRPHPYAPPSPAPSPGVARACRPSGARRRPPAHARAPRGRRPGARVQLPAAAVHRLQEASVHGQALDDPRPGAPPPSNHNMDTC